MVRKKGKQLNPGQVIIPVGHPNPPESHEVNAAMSLARHYRTSVEFLVPVDDYKRKTADIVMHGAIWEIKCPKGASKTTIGAQFRRASRQSGNIVLDTRRTKLEYERIKRQVIIETKQRTSIKKVILINKSGIVIEL